MKVAIEDSSPMKGRMCKFLTLSGEEVDRIMESKEAI